MKTICLNTLLALGGSSIEGQTMVFNSFAIVREIFHISSLVRRKPKSPLAANHDYVSDLVRLCLWIYILLGVGCRELGPLWFAPAYIKYMCDWKI